MVIRSGRCLDMHSALRGEIDAFDITDESEFCTHALTCRGDIGRAGRLFRSRAVNHGFSVALSDAISGWVIRKHITRANCPVLVVYRLRADESLGG